MTRRSQIKEIVSELSVTKKNQNNKPTVHRWYVTVLKNEYKISYGVQMNTILNWFMVGPKNKFQQKPASIHGEWVYNDKYYKKNIWLEKIKFPILYILGNTSLTRDIKRLNEFVKASREKIWMDRKTGCYH